MLQRRLLITFAWLLCACLPVTVPPSPTPIQIPTLTPSPSDTPTPAAELQSIIGDVRVRQAIAHCTNRAELLRAVYPWLTNTGPFEMDSFLPREHWAYPVDDSVLLRYPFDPERGAALLAEAGWALAEGAEYRANAAGEELALKLTTTDSQFRQTWAAGFEAQMKNCGIHLLRLHVPATWFFGETTGLARRDFEMAAFAWGIQSDSTLRQRYACEAIPTPENDWQGQNYAGWCNAQVEAALQPEPLSREAYQILQAHYTRDLPELPLFNRVEVNATHPALENFAPPDPGEVFTWNAAQWRIPGQDTLIIGERSEPASLFTLAENAYVTQALSALITGLDAVQRGYAYEPLMLVARPVPDADNTSTYTFVAGLRWSDGAPVSKADYELGYRIGCDPFFQRAVCDQIAHIDFMDDTTYRVTWNAAVPEWVYAVPPLPRLPAHQRLADGRWLAEVPAAEWPDLDEVRRGLMGVGPYVLKEWTYGERMVFAANPFYYRSAPATPNLVVHFIPQGQTASDLLAGKVDVLASDSVGPEQAAVLLEGQAAGKARVFIAPSNSYEHITFAIFP